METTATYTYTNNTHREKNLSFGWTVEIRDDGGLGLFVLCSCLYIDFRGVGAGKLQLVNVTL